MNPRSPAADQQADQNGQRSIAMQDSRPQLQSSNRQPDDTAGIMNRFVVLMHDYPRLHWDFLLQEGNRLLAWRLAEPPRIGTPISATPLPDHRLMYLDYEGPVSGNRGTVERVISGQFEFCPDPGPPDPGPRDLSPRDQCSPATPQLHVRLLAENCPPYAVLLRQDQEFCWSFR